MAQEDKEIEELKDLTEEQFEDTSFWSDMLDEPEDPSFVERPEHTEGFLDDAGLPIFTEDTTTEVEPSQEEKEENKKNIKKLSPLLIIIILLFITSTTTVVVYKSFFSGSGTPQSKGENVSSSVKEEQENVDVAIKEVQHYSTVWEPFWLRIVKEGKERFLTVSFTTMTTTDKVIQEIQHKEVLLRDAIYYYLQNIELSTSQETIDKIKKDVVAIINSYITAGTVESIGIESFFIQ